MTGVQTCALPISQFSLIDDFYPYSYTYHHVCIRFDSTWLDLIWFDLYCSYSFGMVVRVISICFILSYLTLLYLILFIINYYIIWCYLCINIWCDMQCCWLSNNIYYYSIMILISEWYDSFILCCCQRSFGSCKAPTW